MFMRVDGIQSGKNHRLDFFESWKWFNRRPVIFCDGVPDLGIRDVLDIRDNKSNFARDQFLDLYRLGSERPQWFDLKNPPVRPQPDLLSPAHLPPQPPPQHHPS